MNAKATYYLQLVTVLILSIVANCGYASVVAIDRGRLIQSVAANRPGGFDRETTGYDFAGYGFVDRLTYQYRGNQVTSITDEAPDVNYLNAFHFSDGSDIDDEYLYDANGNTITDLNRGIWDIHYDVNNRPRAISFASGAVTRYIYSADSVKLRTEHIIPGVPPVVAMDGSDQQNADATPSVITTTDYCGRFIYEDGALDRINLDNGYLSYRDASGNRLSSPQYHFFLRDHLGNNRVDLCAGDASFARVNHYYPFGLPMYIPGSLSRDTQRWKFGNKEFDRTSGLDLYDFEARAYDPATIRFYRPDDLAHNYHQVSSYVYCLNNPLINIDKDGKDITILIASKGASGLGHMAAVIQNGAGAYFYVTAGADTSNANITMYSNTSVKCVMNVELAKNAKDMAAAIEYAKLDDTNEKYDNQITFKTSETMDENMVKVATDKAAAFANGRDKYRLWTNNCADIIEDIFEKGTGVDLPTGLSPIPNSNFKNIVNNKTEIQNNLNDKK